jgi:hypothetical protein
MEKITFLFNEHNHRKFESVLKEPPEFQRLLFYSGDLHGYQYITKKETDTHIYWSLAHRSPMYENDKLFFFRKTNSGVTYTKKTKTTKIWFGDHYNRLSSEIRNSIIEQFAPWFLDDVPHSIHSLMNNTIFSHIVKGKITNYKDIVAQYLKTSPYKKINFDLDLFTDVFVNNVQQVSPKQFKLLFLCAANPNEALEYIRRTFKNSYYYDTPITMLCYNAICLGKKIDVNITDEEAVILNKEYLQMITNQKIIYKTIEDVN